MLFLAQPRSRRRQPPLVVDAAFRALPVRRNVEPCGQPMRLVTTHSGPRDDDRASDVVPPTRCSRWTTQGRMDLTSGCSPSECLPQQTLSKC
uniref:Uncharacterized protein n=1 Tax=Zea mays TaxID=4577 RepID=A0A804ML13_MAIZE